MKVVFHLWETIAGIVNMHVNRRTMKKEFVWLKTCIEYLLVKWNREFVPKLSMYDFSKYIKENCKQPLVGVELGVDEGNNAFNILSTLPIKKLYLVDPYIKYDINDKGTQSRKDVAIKKLRRFKDKTVFIYKTSKEAVKYIPDNVDFVYIDGNHDYDFVKRDIELYYPKVKDGGVFGGDDFSIRCMGVARAVIEFLDKYNLDVCYGDSTDWWVVKNRKITNSKWVKKY
jgi:hypothetical protein